ncbi:sodium:solute symporter family protein [Patescibacteria group bacterium]|nr:sodium:solute symporter family protein [Patescibacteria group bacterium]
MDIKIIVLLVYLVLLFGMAWFFSRRESLDAYFLNKRKTSLWMMTFSTIATVVGAGATVAIVSEVYRSGISYGIALPISLVAGMVVLGILAKQIKIIGDKYNAYTIVDFFRQRFDFKNGMLVSILQLFLLTIWIGVQAVALASLTSVLIGVNYNLALLVVAAVTVLYTSIGGLKIDILTDFVQFWIFSLAFIVMAVMGYNHVGGISNLLSQLPAGHLDPLAFGGMGWFIGMIVLSGFLYLGNTAHWQRVLSAENSRVARNSFFISIPFMLILGVLILFLGLVATVSLGDVKPETAIFALMDSLLPGWLAGVGFAAILAVIMSSIDSLLIGGSTILYKAFLQERERGRGQNILYARILTAAFGIFGFVLAFLVPNIITLSLLVTYLALIFIPPIFVGIYGKRFSPEASFYAILVPVIVLFAAYPFVGENTFIITTPLGVLIVLLYDLIFRRKIAPSVA